VQAALSKVQELEQRQVAEDKGSRQQAVELTRALQLIQMAAIRAKSQMGDEVARHAKGMEEIRGVIREEINAEGS